MPRARRATTDPERLPHFGSAMTINPDKIRVRQIRAAEGYLELDMPDHALRELNRIHDAGNFQFHVHLMRGEALRAKSQYEQALDWFRQAHLEKPTDLSALFGMAWCFKRIDQIAQAIDAMKLAYQFHKDEPVVLYNLACYYSLAGDKDNALSWLGRSLRMDRRLLDKIHEESDFDPLRNDSDFQHLLELSSQQAT
jgi:Flp pilus assembly protein TadD